MTLSVKQICERYGVGKHSVLQWIRTSELRAINVGHRPGAKKPRWRITEDALAAFEALRTPTPAPSTKRRRRLADQTIAF